MAGSNLLSLLGWTFLPNLVTGWVQSIYYGLTIRAGDRKPAPNSPRYAEHRRRIHILVVSLRASRRHRARYQEPFPPSRALHHPDKVMSSAGGGDAADSADFFMHLKTASDTLVDPARRFAYERFGPDIVAWKHCVTIRDYVIRGVQVLVPYYGFAAVAMTAATAAKSEGMKPGEASEKALQQSLDRLEQTAWSMDVDAARLMELEMAPFAGDAEVIGSMRSKLKEWLVQNTIRADPMVKDALGRSFQKRRVDAPAGAKGNR
ncbi:hypothetical protein GL218_05704 [Daldinia childiae]|uniref:uncharacterized protein n=1 Tax=Daldinia childiae TaxID=326645 RepID=UPI0014456A89|nr:uncharacterized protein GL218_05704 [Daldinia childiae]KAF3058443.1 hypothetical protein GL218_05704 [Daldinia childiae]